MARKYTSSGKYDGFTKNQALGIASRSRALAGKVKTSKVDPSKLDAELRRRGLIEGDAKD